MHTYVYAGTLKLGRYYELVPEHVSRFKAMMGEPPGNA
jgi:hypothetical protein